jgi:hypothetical protein
MECRQPRVSPLGIKYICGGQTVRGIEVIVAKDEVYTTLQRIDRCPKCGNLVQYTLRTPSAGDYNAHRIW